MQPTQQTTFSGPFFAVPAWAAEMIFKHGKASYLQVLTGMVSLMDRRTQRVVTSVTQLSEHVNLSKETVKRALEWFKVNNVVTVSRASRTSTNVYSIQYAGPQLGSPMTLATPPTRVTHDPSAKPTRVTHDPSESPQPLTTQGKSQNTIDNTSNTDTIKGIEGFDPVEGTVILGSDPDSEPPQMSKTSKKPKRPVNDLHVLVAHFVRHPSIVMSKSYGLAETNVVRKTVRLLLDAGMSRSTISQMIDQFYSVERFRSSDKSVYLFANKEIQSELLATVGGTVDADDPVLMLMQSDFVRTEDNLPWDSPCDALLRRAVIMRGLDACYRYPELVASIAHQYSGNFTDFQFLTELSALNDLVLGLSVNHDKEVLKTHLALITIPLPKELVNLNSNSLRPSADTIKEAVYKYRRS